MISVMNQSSYADLIDAEDAYFSRPAPMKRARKNFGKFKNEDNVSDAPNKQSKQKQTHRLNS